MNIYRFAGLPNALKPAITVTCLLSLILAGAGTTKEGESTSGGWFFWPTIILQFIVMVVVVVLFLFEAERFLTLGRDAWPVIVSNLSTTVTF